MTLRDMLAQSLDQSQMCPTCGRNLVYVCNCQSCRENSNKALHEIECTGCLAAKLLKPSNVPVHS